MIATHDKVPQALDIKGAPRPCLMIQEEASQCMEGMPVVALQYAMRRGGRIVFAGDHRQLPPVILSEAARRAGHDISMHKRLIVNVGSDASMVHTLRQHYRAHPEIMYMYNQLFYCGILECMVLPRSRPALQGLKAPPMIVRPDSVPDSHDQPLYGGLNCDQATGRQEGDVHRIILVHIDADEANTPTMGRANLHEADNICKLVAKLAPACTARKLSVLVIVPYAVQLALLEHGASCSPAPNGQWLGRWWPHRGTTWTASVSPPYHDADLCGDRSQRPHQHAGGGHSTQHHRGESALVQRPARLGSLLASPCHRTSRGRVEGPQ